MVKSHKNYDYRKYKIMTNCKLSSCFSISTFFKHYTYLNIIKILKLKLKGKTLRIKKYFHATIYFKVGKTHPSLSFIFFNVFFKKKAKQKFFFFGYCYWSLFWNMREFSKWKRYNIYHWRGIRPVRTTMIRKDGKVSEYFK